MLYEVITVKYLQNQIAPARTPWLPHGDVQVQRFINDIVREEETDEGIPLEDGTPTYTSHFNLYALAMEEVKTGSNKLIKEFVDKVTSSSLEEAFKTVDIPSPAKEFMKTTFGFIESDKPHVVAAAFALGREHIRITSYNVCYTKLLRTPLASVLLTIISLGLSLISLLVGTGEIIDIINSFINNWLKPTACKIAAGLKQFLFKQEKSKASSPVREEKRLSNKVEEIVGTRDTFCLFIKLVKYFVSNPCQ